jgi:hypothetical protein
VVEKARNMQGICKLMGANGDAKARITALNEQSLKADYPPGTGNQPSGCQSERNEYTAARN